MIGTTVLLLAIEAYASVPVELLTRPLVAPTREEEPEAPQPVELDQTGSQIAQLQAEPDAPAAADAPAPRFAPDPILTKTKRPTSSRTKAARERLRARRAAKVKARDYFIAGVILFAIIALIGSVAYMVLRDDASAARPAGDDDAAAETTEPPHPPLLSATPANAPAKPLPTRLFGVWELRTDDERSGSMEYRADGTASFLAEVGGQESAPNELRWTVLEEAGDELTVELGNGAGQPGICRLRLLFTSPDAFTVIGKIELGIEKDSANRFVRRSAGHVEPPPHPAVP